MSWSINHSGTKADVLGVIEVEAAKAIEHGHMKAEQRDMLRATVNASVGDSLHLVANGHNNANSCSISINATGYSAEAG